MSAIKINRWFFLSAVLFLFVGCQNSFDLEKLNNQDRQTLDSILIKTTELVEAWQASGKNPNWIEISDLKSVLSHHESIFIKKITQLTPKILGAKTPLQFTDQIKIAYHTLENQPVTQNEKPLIFLAPLVSYPVYQAFEEMMRAMETDIGKRMYIESGHRSKGYHLYNFLKYLKEHDYSLIETGKLNALPGYSQHNIWDHHALDLINAEGINGEPHVEDYESLPEHQWMLQHAEAYGFTLSYPRENPWGIDFEPWHWLYSPKTMDAA